MFLKYLRKKRIKAVSYTHLFEDLVEVLEKIRDLLLRDYDISLTVGLDGVVKNPADCCGIYAKVRQLQKDRFALGENQVIYPARIMEPVSYTHLNGGLLFDYRL